MRIIFASFAALTLTAVQAGKMKQEEAKGPTAHKVEEPMSYTGIMDSVKSLEKAYEFHKNEGKLLNEINTELKEYWNMSDN
jgi:hypothetical protein